MTKHSIDSLSEEIYTAVSNLKKLAEDFCEVAERNKEIMENLLKENEQLKRSMGEPSNEAAKK